MTFRKEKFQKKIKKNENDLFLILFIFASKSWICKEFRNLEPESESQIWEDHELWNHEMWGPPVFQN